MEYQYTPIEKRLAEEHIKEMVARDHMVNWRGVCDQCGGKFQRRGSGLVYVQMGGKFYHITCACHIKL